MPSASTRQGESEDKVFQYRYKGEVITSKMGLY